MTLFIACFATTFGEKQQNFEGYVFIYFTGNTFEGENIYIAASQGNDALNFTDLNGGKPIILSKYGTKGLRDPFIIRSQEGDKFYLLATDLSMASTGDWGQASSHGSRYLEIWESTDLINWSEQRHVLVTAPLNVGCTWAPEAHYDKNLGKYLVYWASTLYKDDDTNHTGPTYQRQVYATTEDFVTFSEPQVWQEDGFDRIDTTVFEEDGTFYRFLVGEADGCHDIIGESSTKLTESIQGWHLDLSCLRKKVQAQYVEGPTCFKSNPGDVRGEKYYLFVDEAGGRGYVPLETDDIKNATWKISESYKMPTRSRHGTVIPVTAEELAKIRSALG